MEFDNDYISKVFKRDNRNRLLRESDFYVLPDYPISTENLETIKEYRQKLRDYTKHDKFINFNSKDINYSNFPDFPIFPF